MTNKTKGFVFAGTLGEMSCVSAVDLAHACTFNGQTITEQLIRSKAKTIALYGGSAVVMDWIKIQTTPGQLNNAACFVPVHQKGQVETSFGVSQYNTPGVPHGTGDFIVCSVFPDGTPKLATRRVVNGLQFSRTYNLDCFKGVTTEEQRKCITIDQLPVLHEVLSGGEATANNFKAEPLVSSIQGRPVQRCSVPKRLKPKGIAYSVNPQFYIDNPKYMTGMMYARSCATLVKSGYDVDYTVWTEGSVSDVGGTFGLRCRKGGIEYIADIYFGVPNIYKGWYEIKFKWNEGEKYKRAECMPPMPLQDYLSSFVTDIIVVARETTAAAHRTTHELQDNAAETVSSVSSPPPNQHTAPTNELANCIVYMEHKEMGYTVIIAALTKLFERRPEMKALISKLPIEVYNKYKSAFQ